jgi:NADH:ubiquinone oxidoreductase subunit 5 (subunit L)/multisubunit Na+/H+ antiporter MnhA subunit
MAVWGTELHMINHSMFKLVLFMSAGAVYMNTHKLNLNDIRGFGRRKPALMLAFLCGCLGIAGVPLFSGYISKTLLHESIVEAIEHTHAFGFRLVEWLFLFSGGVTVAYMTKLFVALFIEKHPTRQAEFDAKKRYMNPVSTAALAISALLIPVLGLSANRSMNAVADLGTDFCRSGPLAHAVHYLAWENLKGGLISIAIGFALYFGVVRTVLMRRENGVRVYVNRWPARLDLEELVYRPLLRWLPGLLGPLAALFGENRISTPLARGVWKLGCRLAALFGENRITEPAAKRVFRIASGTSAQFGENRVLAPAAKRGFKGLKVAAHALSDLVDALVLLLKKTVYRDSPPPEKDEARASLPYRFGKRIDRIAIRRGHEEQGGRRYAITAYRARRTLRDTGRRMTDNLSFALLMLVGAISLIFLYMLVLR